MKPEPLDVVPLWAFFIAAIMVSIAALEAGYRYGRWRHTWAPDEKESPVGAMVASILGLLAIMLAFTFNLAASRFDARRQGVLEEANAIGTTALRAQVLPEPQRSEIQELLREYVDVRVQSVDFTHINSMLARSEELHAELWSRAASVGRENPQSITIGLFLQSLNEVIDLHAKRVFMGLRSRLPISVWIALFALIVVAMFSVGYQAGLAVTRRSPVELLLALSFAVVLFLIVDLDRAHEGFLRVDQHALTDLQQSLQAKETPQPH